MSRTFRRTRRGADHPVSFLITGLHNYEFGPVSLFGDERLVKVGRFWQPISWVEFVKHREAEIQREIDIFYRDKKTWLEPYMKDLRKASNKHTRQQNKRFIRDSVASGDYESGLPMPNLRSARRARLEYED